MLNPCGASSSRIRCVITKLGSMLDGVGDGMAVRRPDRDGLQDEQVERALEHLSLYGLGTTFRHWLHKIIYLRARCPALMPRVLLRLLLLDERCAATGRSVSIIIVVFTRS